MTGDDFEKAPMSTSTTIAVSCASQQIILRPVSNISLSLLFSGWCQRIKSDFKFEYLEDELSSLRRNDAARYSRQRMKH
jgi:hypothetical protein